MEENNKCYSVTELNNTIKDSLDDNFSNIEVEGEIGNLKQSSGNTYMSLKDSESTIPAIIWRSLYQNMKVRVKEGDKVKISGKLEVYIKHGKYQIIVRKIEVDGTGKLYDEYTQRKEKYEKKNYFDKTRKKYLPENIKAIGIVTSTEGAAIKDVLSVLEKDGYGGKVFIKNCVVQGDNCPSSVKKAIKYFNNFVYDEEKQRKVDVILITRGGGSFEDLFGFSDKKVIEAIHKSEICTISAVGHEIDNMLSDYVADIRTATPSVGATLIACHYKQHWMKKIKVDKLNNVRDSIFRKIESKMDLVDEIVDEMKTPANLITELETMLTEKWQTLEHKMKNKLREKSMLLNHYTQIIAAYNPEKAKKLGYVTVVNSEGSIIKSKKVIAEKEIKYLTLKFPDGNVKVKIV